MSERKPFEFRAEDFFGIMGEDHRVHPTRAADRANALLRQWIEGSPLVYGSNGITGWEWCPHNHYWNTHRARLIQIEELKGEK